MPIHNVYSATPVGSDLTGFIFIDLDSYNAEYEHRQALFGIEKYELQIIDGSKIDQELFTGLKINQDSLIEWFNEIQHLTFDEKVGLWFLVDSCGYDLMLAKEANAPQPYHHIQMGDLNEARCRNFHSLEYLFLHQRAHNSYSNDSLLR